MAVACSEYKGPIKSLLADTDQAPSLIQSWPMENILSPQMACAISADWWDFKKEKGFSFFRAASCCCKAALLLSRAARVRLSRRSRVHREGKFTFD